MDTLLTKKDLAKHFKVSTTTIGRWVDDGIIPYVEGLPSLRFKLEDILKLEGTEINKLSPLERKRLLKDIENLEVKNKVLEKENEDLKEYVKMILGHGIKFIDISKEVI